MSVDITFFEDMLYFSSKGSDLPISVVPSTSIIPNTPVAFSALVAPCVPLQVYSRHSCQPLVSYAPPPQTFDKRYEDPSIAIKKCIKRMVKMCHAKDATISYLQSCFLFHSTICLCFVFFAYSKNI